MCGIVAYVGSEDRAQQVLLDGLRRLEYRGYDSAGLAVIENGKLRVVRSVGKLASLEATLREVAVSGRTGIGHTRWATHGRPSEANAHPHRSGSVALVHNGIIENHTALRRELEERGTRFQSETDTEIIAHLIYEQRRAGHELLGSIQRVIARLEGAYALVAIDEHEPERVVAAKNGGSPVILGIGRGENFVASDIPAILPYTRNIVSLLDGEIAQLTAQSIDIFDAGGKRVQRAPRAIVWDPIQAEKGGYQHFMHKEIYEQPRAISQTIGTRALEESGEIVLDGIELAPEWVRGMREIRVVGCGTACYAGLVGSYMIEQLAKVSVRVEVASEFRYREPLLGRTDLAIAISQSGETADTLGALRAARAQGALTIAITNCHDSTIAREAHNVLYTHAGPEIGVASTKCFTTQVVTLYMLGLKLGAVRGHLSREEVREAIVELRRLPRLVEDTLSVWPEAERVAREYLHKRDYLFLGRGVGFPIALEGALKLKEVSYVHAEGYASGEMKHGPIALVDDGTPVVLIANQKEGRAKLLSSAQEVRARGAAVIAIGERGDTELASIASHVLYVTAIRDPLSAILSVIPLQMFAYHIARLKGTDVDQPRNLAKSVTVE